VRGVFEYHQGAGKGSPEGRSEGSRGKMPCAKARQGAARFKGERIRGEGRGAISKRGSRESLKSSPFAGRGILQR